MTRLSRFLLSAFLGVFLGLVYIGVVVERQTTHWYGTGFFITSTGDLVTAGHVCGTHKTVGVVEGDIVLKGTVIARDRFDDICLVHVNNVRSRFLPLRINTKGTYTVGIYGYPEIDKYGQNLKMYRGIASHSRFIVPAGRGGIVFAAESHPGNSGGPIIGNDGYVLGELTDGYVGIDSGFGTDSNTIVKYALELGLNIIYTDKPEPLIDLDRLKADLINSNVIVMVFV